MLFNDLRHSVEFLCKTRLLVGSGILFDYALGNGTVNNRAGVGEELCSTFLIAGSDQRKEFLTSVLISDLIALFLAVFLSITKTRFLADFMLGIYYLLVNDFTLNYCVILSYRGIIVNCFLITFTNFLIYFVSL